MKNDTAAKTILVAFLLCIVCSVLVSGSSVLLKPIQKKNQEMDIKKNILLTGGLISEDRTSVGDIERAFEKVEPVVIDLQSGEIDKNINPLTYDQRKAARDILSNIEIPASLDLAGIKTRAKSAVVYLVKKDGALDQLILGIHGKGLWSTLYGFLALDKDTTTIRGLTFYEHGETPGLGGEIDNPSWKSLWKGKRAFNENWEILLEVVKGKVDSSNENSIFQVDGLSGSTLTGRGVTNLLRYWLSANGYGTFLAKIRESVASEQLEKSGTEVSGE